MGIGLQGKSLGRKSHVKIEEEKIINKKDNSERQKIEGLFGVLKRKYGMDLLLTKLAASQKVSIGMLFCVYNLERWMSRSFLMQRKSIYYVA